MLLYTCSPGFKYYCLKLKHVHVPFCVFRTQADLPPRPHSRGANDSTTRPPGQTDLPNRPHSRGAGDSAAYPGPPPAMRKPMNRPMPREQIPPGPIPGQLPKLDEHPPRQYGMPPPPATTPTRQMQQQERLIFYCQCD